MQAGYVGYAATIQVNPAVTTNPPWSATAPTPTAREAFTPNPSGGPAGFTSLITLIINDTFGTQAPGGRQHPALNTTGLGAIRQPRRALQRG